MFVKYNNSKIDDRPLNIFFLKLLSNDSRYIKHPFGLSIHNEWLYFTDWSLKAVLKMNKFSGEDISIIANVNEKQPMSIAIVSNDTNNCWLNPCLNFKCNQNYQSVITNDGKCACICSKGYIYDQKLSMCVQIKICPRGQFRCSNSLQCIKQEYVCDKKIDCNDSSDEANCTTKCEPEKKYFKCKNDSSKCLSIDLKCNKKFDCQDQSDEEGCIYKCNSFQFQCFNNNRCIEL